ncbi:sigma-70 family RNA polymerase sigma factor [Rapidithrix thailandica]|uniref:Sigma-70 family RNA polymerase sigma factor n=1 Tax=Rapidithrix thailandica TaxID=413964 RepID=A0AAW9SAH7_9BACT
MKLKIQKSTTETDLIKKCRKQNASAQAALYEKYSPVMYAVCLRYIKEPGEAEEVMINGFMKAFDKLGQFKFEGSFEGWLRRIMVNESLMYLRKNKHMYLEVDIEQADYAPNYQQLSDHLEAEDLMKMVGQLPMGYRTVFNLYAIEGYSHKEIAEQLGISENTSKSQLSRARALLQKFLRKSEMSIHRTSINHGR